MTNLEKIELQCRKLIAAKTSQQRSEILADSIGYLGLAQAYVALADEFLELKKWKAEQEFKPNRFGV